MTSAKQKLIEEAVKQTWLAYIFVEANSYTHSAYSACLAAATFTESDWIEQFLEWGNRVHQREKESERIE
jgi:hypothetical protein